MNTYYSSTILTYWFTLIWITAYILACTDDTSSANSDISEIIEEDAWNVPDQNPIERDMMMYDAGIAFTDITSPEYCGSCHQTHYEQWQGSMHAYAIRDPIFLALNKKGIQETNGKLDQFCVQCHAPNASQLGYLPVIEGDLGSEMPIDLENPLIRHGVQCISCHNIEEVEATQNAKVIFSDSTHFGPFGGEAANQAHPMSGSALFSDPFQKNVMCGGCHDFVNPNGVRLDSTFSSWYSNDFNDVQNPTKHKTCQDCHMPEYEGQSTVDSPSKTLHSHYFIGVYQALLPGFPGRPEMAEAAQELLSTCAELDVRYNGIDSLGDAVIVVSVQNINNGHNLPAGSTADTQVWVHLQVFNEDNDLVFESGMTDENGNLMDGVVGHSLTPDGDPELMLFGQFVYGETGSHVNFPWQAHSFTDNLIPPGQRRWRDFPIPAVTLIGDEFRAVATLKYRTFPPFLLRILIEDGYLDPNAIDPIPIIEMKTVEKIFRLD